MSHRDTLKRNGGERLRNQYWFMKISIEEEENWGLCQLLNQKMQQLYPTIVAVERESLIGRKEEEEWVNVGIKYEFQN